MSMHQTKRQRDNEGKPPTPSVTRYIATVHTPTKDILGCEVYLVRDVDAAMQRQAEALAAAQAQNKRLENELKAWRPKSPFLDSQLPPPIGDHPTVQIYREKVIEFRDRYLRLATYLSQLLGCSVETLCEANLLWGRNRLEQLEQQLATLKEERDLARQNNVMLLQQAEEHHKTLAICQAEKDAALRKQDELAAVLIARGIQPQRVLREDIFPTIRKPLLDQLARLRGLVEDCHEAVAMSTNCEGCQIAYDKIQAFKNGA